MNDKELIDHITAAFDEIEPVPDDLTAVAFAAIGMRDLDAQLADLLFDSWAADQEVVMRSTATASRVMTFAVGACEIDIELHADGTVVGQVELVDTRSAETIESLVLELGSGGTETAAVDSAGRFRATVPSGSFRLRVAGILTPWITR